jgi:phosphomannomutase
VLDAFKTFVGQQAGWSITPNNYEGVHVTSENGWVLLRKSLHDPQMPINVESDVEGGVDAMVGPIRGFLSAFDGLKLPAMD